MSRIHRSLINAAAIVVGAVSLATPLMAQAPGSGTVLHVSPYAGYMVFGDYLKGPLGTSVSNAPAPIYGTQVGLSLAPNLSLIGNIGYTQSDIKVGIPILGGLSVGHSSMLIYDGGLEYNLGSAIGGRDADLAVRAGWCRRDSLHIDESILTTQATNLAGNVGVGADLTCRARHGAAPAREGLHRQVQLQGRNRTRHFGRRPRTTGRSARDCDSTSNGVAGWGGGGDAHGSIGTTDAPVSRFRCAT